jgi:hypothetical protein
MVTVSFRDETTLGDHRLSWAMEIFEERLPLRELIRRRIHQEVAEYNAARPTVFHGLVQPAGASIAPGGFRLDRPRRIDAEQQYELAVQAFTRNGFVVLVGDRQVEELDDVVDLHRDTDVTFLRLVALVGG